MAICNQTASKYRFDIFITPIEYQMEFNSFDMSSKDAENSSSFSYLFKLRGISIKETLSISHRDER